MKTPWFALYRSGDMLGDKLGPFTSRLVGTFYFAAVALVVGCAKVVLHFIARGSTLDVYMQAHFDTVLFATLAIFAVYVLARGFWDAFRTIGTDRQNVE